MKPSPNDLDTFARLLQTLIDDNKDCSWEIRGIVTGPNLEGFQKQEDPTWDFKYVKQSGDDDYGFSGVILYPLNEKFLQILFAC